MTEFSHTPLIQRWALLPKLFSCSRALPEAWQQGIVPALYLLLQTRGQCLLQSGISLPSRATGFHVHALPGLVPGRISPLALHVQSPGRPHEMPSRGRQCSTSGREEGRFLPLKVNASMTEFAPSLTCISNKTQSTPVLTPPHSEDVKENVHRNLEEQKCFFYSRCLCKEMGQMPSPKSQSWLKADQVYLISVGRDALITQGCPLFPLPGEAPRLCQVPEIF